jgi:hypothetical protein
MADALSGDLYDIFLKIIENGNEQEVKDFLLAHLKEFREEDQKEIILAFFEDAVEKQGRRENDVAAFQKEGIALLEGLSNANKDLKRRDALLEIKEKI